MDKELNKLIDQKYIFKLDKSSSKQFIGPSVLTVKKDQTVKQALDSKKIIKINHKNKYQMSNIDQIAQISKTKEKEPTLFSTIELLYAFSQIHLDSETKKNNESSAQRRPC